MTDDADHGLLAPGWAGTPVAAATGDSAVLAALVEVEAAMATVAGAPATADRIRDVGASLNPRELAIAARAGGNPVIPLVGMLRDRLPADDAAALHRGATSQDVLDSALALVATRAAAVIADDAAAATHGLIAHAEQHRGTVVVGRTLTQAATPTTLGLRLAGWAWTVARAARAVRDAAAAFPAQFGGAGGTGAAVVTLDGPGAAVAAADRLAAELGLAAPIAPWHVLRSPVTRLGDALAELCAALGTVGRNVATLARTEVGEVDDGAGGGSSAMPHKANPTRAVLLVAASVEAPPLAATLHAAAATVDERPDGAWHAEWSALRALLRTAGGAAATGRELADGLRVYPDRIAANLAASADDLLSERAKHVPGPAAPADYLGDADAFTDRLLDAARKELG